MATTNHSSDAAPGPDRDPAPLDARREPRHEDVFKPEFYDELQPVVARLDRFSQLVVTLRLGLNGEPPHAMDELGDALRRSGERLRRAERRAFQLLLAQARAARGWSPSLDAILGPDSRLWAARCWAHAAHRESWESRLVEAHLLLCLRIGSRRTADRLLEDYLAGHARVLEEDRARDERETARVPNRREHAATEMVKRLAAQALWPGRVQTLDNLGEFRPQRAVMRGNLRSHAGDFHSVKLGRRVEFESGWEAKVFRQFELAPAVRSYVEQPCRLAVSIDGSRRSYVPDAIVHLDDGRVIVVEIKPEGQYGVFTHWLRWATAFRWCEERGFGLLIGSDRGTVADVFRQRDGEEELRSALLTQLAAHGELSWPEVRDLTSTCGVSTSLISPVTVRNLLDWRLSPYRIRKPPPGHNDQLALAAAWWEFVEAHANSLAF